MKEFKKIFIGLVLIILCIFFIDLGNVMANTLFSDDFNSENGGVKMDNYDNFAKWNVTRDSVFDAHLN